MDPALQLPRIPGAPLLVTAPVPRCGTTLVQRLLNSSSNTLVFGEPVAGALTHHVKALTQQARGHLPRAEEYRIDLQRALDGEQFWCPHLMPDATRYVALWARTLIDFIRFHEKEVLRLGLRSWGAKCPSIPIEELRDVRRTIPDSRVVYVVRNVYDTIRSAKGRGFVKSPEDVREWAKRWARGLNELKSLASDPNVLVVRLEDLRRVDRRALDSLEHFTGARDLSRDVLHAKVNTWASQAVSEYTLPEPLSEREMVVIEATAGSALGSYHNVAVPT